MSEYQFLFSGPSASTQFLQVIALSGSSLAAGIHVGTSVVSIPGFLQSPSPSLAKQWKVLYDRGIRLIVPLAVSSSAAFAYLAYIASAQYGTNQARLYGAAAVSAIGFAPFTRLLMWNTNLTLMEAAEKTQAAGKTEPEGEVRDLIKKWGDLNLIRGFLPLAAVVFGTLSISYRA